jgi:hypothetical protein
VPRTGVRSRIVLRLLKADVRVSKLPMSSLLRAWVIGETRGLMKALIHVKATAYSALRCLAAEAGRGVGCV